MGWQERLLKADINISAAGDNTVITIGVGEMPAAWENGAVFVAIDHVNLLANGATTLQFKSGTVAEGQTSYGGQYTLAAGQAITLENAIQNELGIITLGANRSFVINLGSAVQVSGFIRFRLMASN